ncbi:DUF4145 domain-containing protein [Clostridium botulinum]|uniref:DUF4145 domain-containing protein n=1 Tax=Clostridium botulinum TaxID=1491 RepID=UPI0023B833E3|nr:DUF4145 domain-containing protein [Clostridium botulinum]
MASMVSKGLPREVQQALDIIRVTGNDSVHPGEINLEDNEDMVIKLFSILNFIVDKLIVEPKEMEEVFNWLPDSKKRAIEKRDKKNS